MHCTYGFFEIKVCYFHDLYLRTITSLYNTKGPDTCLPIWVVCDGKTADHRGGHIRLMHAEKRDGLICVGVAVDLGPTNSETNPRDLIAKLDQTADRIRGLVVP